MPILAMLSGVSTQDTASPQMEALLELNNNIMFYAVIILFGAVLILFFIATIHARNKISKKYLNHGTLIELVWGIFPGLILMLVLIGFPSYILYILVSEMTFSSFDVYVVGDQWYWSYHYPDFLSENHEELEFDSYLVLESDSEKGSITLLMDNPYSMSIQSVLEPGTHPINDNRPLVNIEYIEVSKTTHFIYDTQDTKGSHLHRLRYGSAGAWKTHIINDVAFEGIESRNRNVEVDKPDIRKFRISDRGLNNLENSHRVTSRFSDLVVEGKFALIHKGI